MDPLALIREATHLVSTAVLAHQYVVLFVVIALEEGGLPLPVPGDVVIAYYGSRATGDLVELAQVVLVCAAASTAGTLAPYWIARRLGDRVTAGFARWVDVDPERLRQAQARIARRGAVAVLVGRLVPGLRVVMSVVSGSAGVPVRAFAPAVFVAGCIYWSAWVAAGAIVGPAIGDLIEGSPWRYSLVLVPASFVAYLVYRHMRGARRTTAGRPRA